MKADTAVQSLARTGSFLTSRQLILSLINESVKYRNMDIEETLDKAFAALAHPARRAILVRLTQSDASVNTLAEPLDMSLPAVSRHIRVLEDAGLITRSQQAQFRPCALNPKAMKAVNDWTAQYSPIWQARFDEMEEILNKLKDTDMTSDGNWVKIERRFDANINLVWDMWTKPELFQTWYGPNGFKVPEAEMDTVVGGIRKICMKMETPERTMQMWFTGVYKEINAPHRLVYTESMCDADGVIISPQSMGMPDGHPDVTEVIVELREDGDGTVMTMIHVGVPEGSAGGGGWTQAFDKLDKAVAG